MAKRDIALVLSAIIFLACLVNVLYFNYLSNLDISINNFFSGLRNPELTTFMSNISSFASPEMLFVLSFFIVLFLIFRILYTHGNLVFSRNKERKTIVFGVMILGGYFLESAIKILVHRTRPENILVIEKTFSFPSAHALMSMILFPFLIYLVLSRLKNNPKKYIPVVLSILAIFFIGVSRLYLGAHWFSDVLAGWSLGLFWFFLMLKFYKGKVKHGKRMRTLH